MRNPRPIGMGEMRWPVLALVACVLLSDAARGGAGVAGSPPAIGESIRDLTAKDISGATFSLAQLDPNKLIVFAFVGVDCPLANRYASRINELASKYEPRGVLFIAVDSNRQDSLTAIAAFARRHEVKFPVLKDLRQAIANRLGAMRTPQVVVLDREHKIRYRGRIDDQFGFVPNNQQGSYHRPGPKQFDLQRALDELLANKPVTVPETPPSGCLIGRDLEPVPHPSVTYAKDVAPILNRRCVACHRPQQIAPFALTSYEEAAGWADMIAEVTQSNRMPPWHADPQYGSFLNDARLGDEEKHILADWASAGAPEGNRADLPQSANFPTGWMIPEPDEIIPMSQQAYRVPASGVIPYQFFVVDPGWKEDRWVSAIEPRPGNRSVVHHILLFVLPPDAPTFQGLRADDTYFAAYAPGMKPEQLPTGFARPLQAGSKLLFNIHYAPNGSPQEDLSYVGIKFADPRSVVREVTTSSAFNKTFQLSPELSRQEVRSQYILQRDSLLLSLIPHMHLRGKDFSYEATYPDGRREMLLSVPNYDFGWQTVYRLREPKQMPSGTVINCVAHYDNSESNLNNPNPKAKVGWGDQTFDEMMVGFFEIAPAAEGLVPRTSWWQLVAGRITWEALGAIVLTIINLILIVGWIARLRRSGRTSRAQEVSTPTLDGIATSQRPS